MSDPFGSRDNGHSFAGLYGLANPIVTWLIGRGYGELVALTPEEMQRQEVAPRCKAKAETAVLVDNEWRWGTCPDDHVCGNEMRYRPEGWVCYEHETPVRVRRAMRLQNIPKPPFSTFDVIGKTVEVVYRRDQGEARGSWKWLVDGEVYAR